MIKLSDHFTYRRLLRYTLPSIIMMVFTAVYGVVDGFFISNWTGSTAFAAINLVWPFAMLFSAVGFMFGTGGTALVAYTFGTGRSKDAKEIFSLITYAGIILGVVLTIVAEVFLQDVAVLLGASEEMLPYSLSYGRILLAGLMPFMLQSMFQSFFVAAEKPKLGMIVTIASGMTNIIFDALLVAVLGCGVVGAAWATFASQIVGGIIPLVYFLCPNKSILRLGRPCRKLSMLFRPAATGRRNSCPIFPCPS